MLQQTVPPPIPPHLITAAETARRLSVAVRTLWRMVSRGDLPQPLRLNRKLIRFRWPDVVAHLDAAVRPSSRNGGEGRP